MPDNRFTSFQDPHNLYVNCRACHEEAIFPAYCRTPDLERRRRVAVEEFKSGHVCEQMRRHERRAAHLPWAEARKKA